MSTSPPPDERGDMAIRQNPDGTITVGDIPEVGAVEEAAPLKEEKAEAKPKAKKTTTKKTVKKKD